jgi:hypothetical protein
LTEQILQAIDEHRRPTDRVTVVEPIAATTTKTGLKVKRALDDRTCFAALAGLSTRS